MSCKIVSSKDLINNLKEQAKKHVKYFYDKTGTTPSLKIIMSGDNPASKSYVSKKRELAQECGMQSEIIYLDENKYHEYDRITTDLNSARDINGYMLQLPIPEILATHNQSLDPTIEQFNIPVTKDVDCLQAETYQGFLKDESSSFAPCTPLGTIRYLKYLNIEIQGTHFAIIGKSRLAGKPLAEMLIKRGGTVTICHSKTKDLKKAISNADVVVPIVGLPGLLNEDNIQKGQVIIDVGVNKVNGKLVGDCDLSCKNKASLITPVPGGVGPLTVMSLITNTIDAAYIQNGMAKPEWVVQQKPLDF